MAIDPNILKQRMGYQNKGMAVVALMAALIEIKNLTLAQRQSVMASYSSMILMALSGAFETLSETITETTPDGVLVTQADLDELAAMIDGIIAES